MKKILLFLSMMFIMACTTETIDGLLEEIKSQKILDTPNIYSMKSGELSIDDTISIHTC